jgi:hypothetical protein|tara:strand:+ start:1094 stop:1294 length:201 start_codon:yes stop_codon:yes gene_type:complete
MIELKIIGKDSCNDSNYAKELLDDFNKKTEDNIKCTYTIDNSIDSLQITMNDENITFDQFKATLGV